MLVTILLPPPKNECQQSVNNFWSWILDNLRAMERRYPIFNLSAAFIGKNSTDYIGSASYNSTPTEGQQFSWGLNTLHSNELHCVVPESSLMQSVFAICCCIQLHKYACNVSLIWLCFACSASQYIRIRILLYYNVTFSSFPCCITQQSNSYRHVGFIIFKYLIAWGYDLFQGWTCLYSEFQRPYFKNHFWCVVGINECRLEVGYCLEWF